MSCTCRNVNYLFYLRELLLIYLNNAKAMGDTNLSFGLNTLEIMAQGFMIPTWLFS